MVFMISMIHTLKRTKLRPQPFLLTQPMSLLLIMFLLIQLAWLPTTRVKEPLLYLRPIQWIVKEPLPYLRPIQWTVKEPPLYLSPIQWIIKELLLYLNPIQWIVKEQQDCPIAKEEEECTAQETVPAPTILSIQAATPRED
jgi:hypothetical protein